MVKIQPLRSGLTFSEQVDLFGLAPTASIVIQYVLLPNDKAVQKSSIMNRNTKYENSQIYHGIQ